MKNLIVVLFSVLFITTNSAQADFFTGYLVGSMANGQTVTVPATIPCFHHVSVVKSFSNGDVELNLSLIQSMKNNQNKHVVITMVNGNYYIVEQSIAELEGAIQTCKDKLVLTHQETNTQVKNDKK